MIGRDDVLATIANWRDGFAEKNAEKMLQDYADHATLIDITPEHHIGKKAIVDVWTKCFPFMPKDAVVSHHDIQVLSAEDSAVFLARAKIDSVAEPENPACTNFVRLTLVFQMVDGFLQVVHEHVSLPIDMQTGKPVSA